MSLQPQTREAGPLQGIALLLSGTLPAMGVVLVSPNLSLLNAAFADVPGGAYLVSIAMTAPALCIALFSPFAGLIVDRFGRRRALLGALLLYGLFGMAPLVLDGLPAIIASRAGVGLVESVIMTAAFALFGDYFEGERRNRWLAYNGAFSAFAATLLYLAGGALGQYGWRAPFAAYGFSFFIAVFVALAAWEPAARSARDSALAKAMPKILRSRQFIAVCALGFLSSILFFIIPLQMSVFLSARGEASTVMIGAIIAVASIGNPIGSYLFRFLSSRTLPQLLARSYIVGGAGLVGMAISPSVLAVGLCAFVNQLGCGLLTPALQAAAMRDLPPHARGRGGGLLITFMFLGQFVCPLVIMTLTNITSGIDLTFLALGLFSVGSAILAALLPRLSNRPAQLEDQAPSEPAVVPFI
ncbi:MFS transporter [Sphingobium sp. YC-XJ3]|nr:MFS transporter [Sphingobium sp. YC-XJ3]WDA36170.1 MFS transporter [Sphingobium sp. YC-XJ3]